MVVDATMDDVSVPLAHVKDGQIVLNIGPQAVRNLSISGEYVMFSGRFAGIAHEVYAPIGAVMGVITKENGEGMWFPRDEEEEPAPTPDGPSLGGLPLQRPPKEIPPGGQGKKSNKGPPSLKVVK